MDNFVMFTCFLGECIGRFTNRKIPYCVKFNPDEVPSFCVFFFNFLTQELKNLREEVLVFIVTFFVIVVILYICSVMKRSDVSFTRKFLFSWCSKVRSINFSTNVLSNPHFSQFSFLSAQQVKQFQFKLVKRPRPVAQLVEHREFNSGRTNTQGL